MADSNLSWTEPSHYYASVSNSLTFLTHFRRLDDMRHRVLKNVSEPCLIWLCMHASSFPLFNGELKLMRWDGSGVVGWLSEWLGSRVSKSNIGVKIYMCVSAWMGWHDMGVSVSASSLPCFALQAPHPILIFAGWDIHTHSIFKRVKTLSKRS